MTCKSMSNRNVLCLNSYKYNRIPIRFEMDNQVFAISKSLMDGPGEDLFDHIAACLFEFAQSRGVDKEVLPLGFTFSFPCRQKGLAVGELITWTKGFKCSGVEGKVDQGGS